MSRRQFESGGFCHFRGLARTRGIVGRLKPRRTNLTLTGLGAAERLSANDVTPDS